MVTKEGKLEKYNYYSVYRPDPGTVDKAYCGTCESEMNVKRNRKGVNGYAAAVLGINRKHDEFRCHFEVESWHRQAEALLKEAERCVSATITRMLKDEATEIIYTKIPTKDMF